MNKTDGTKVMNNEINCKLVGSERLAIKSNISNMSKNRKNLSPDLFRESNSSTPMALNMNNNKKTLLFDLDETLIHCVDG